MRGAMARLGDPALSSRLAAAAVTLPLLLALPQHVDADRVGWNLALAAAIGLFFFAVQAAARRLSGSGVPAGFAALCLLLGVLGFAGDPAYRFSDALADLGLAYLIVFAGAAAACIARPLGRIVVALLAVPLGVAALVRAVHMQVFGFAIDAAGYRAIMHSSPAEAIEFARHFLGAGWLAVAAALLALVGAAALAAPRRLSLRGFAAGGLGAALALHLLLAVNSDPVAARLQGFYEAVDYAGEVRDYRRLLQARQSRAPQIAVSQAAPLAGRAQTYVFVVGESLTRNHMSVYGYWRQTTPALERLAGETAVFTDVVSPHSHTDPSLELVLTLANYENGLHFTDAGNYSLIEILRAAGFATWWISNQNGIGPWDNKTAVLASAAEHRYFSGAAGDVAGGALDEVLLEPLAGALRDAAPRKAIFLHVLGSHWEYAKRYPPGAAVFRRPPGAGEIGALSGTHGRPHLIDEYDNSVRYHDQLVGRVVEMLRATGTPAALALFADHGESVYQMRGHYSLAFTAHHVEVPLLLWFSPAYRELAPEVVARARAAAHLPFALDDLPHLAAGLMQLSGTGLSPELSPLSSAYRAPRKRDLFGRGRAYEDEDLPTLNARRALGAMVAARPELREKIWAYRVDTLGKMMEVATMFSGVEINVLYDAGRRALMVNHPPAPLSGLSLERLLDYADRLNPKLSFWLDVKNLDEATAPALIAELERLDAKHRLKARALVETGHTGPAAAALRAAGFRSSYYLPTRVVARDEAATSPVQCSGADEIRRTVEAGRFAAVSYDWRAQRWVQTCLGAFVRERGLGTYTWDLKPLLSDRARAAPSAQQLREYASMSAVLLPFRSLFEDE